MKATFYHYLFLVPWKGQISGNHNRDTGVISSILSVHSLNPHLLGSPILKVGDQGEKDDKTVYLCLKLQIQGVECIVQNRSK